MVENEREWSFWSQPQGISMALHVWFFFCVLVKVLWLTSPFWQVRPFWQQHKEKVIPTLMREWSIPHCKWAMHLLFCFLQIFLDKNIVCDALVVLFHLGSECDMTCCLLMSSCFHPPFTKDGGVCTHVCMFHARESLPSSSTVINTEKFPPHFQSGTKRKKILASFNKLTFACPAWHLLLPSSRSHLPHGSVSVPRFTYKCREGAESWKWGFGCAQRRPLEIEKWIQRSNQLQRGNLVCRKTLSVYMHWWNCMAGL